MRKTAEKRAIISILIVIAFLILPSVYADDRADLEIEGYELYAMNRTSHEVPIEEEIWIKVKVENEGDTEAENVEVRVIFEETGINTTVEIGDVDPNEVETSRKIMIADDSGDDSIEDEDTYYMIFIVDPDDKINESDEDNNEADSGSTTKIEFYEPECGDGYCDGSEDSEDCCDDCGCEEGEECIDNECETSDECETDNDCDDNDVTTKDECSGTPKECHHTNITSCADDDGYCPSGCTFEEDNDCHECLHDSNCDDGKASTKDECTGNPRKCEHTAITECRDDDGYCPLECEYEDDDDCNPPVVCGDGKCEKNETKFNCCDDCGCEEGYECEDNECRKTPAKEARDALEESVKLNVMIDRLEDDGYELDKLSLEKREKGGFTFTYSYINDEADEIKIQGTVTSAGNVKNIKNTGERSYALPVIGLLGIVFVIGAIIIIALHMRERPKTGYIREEKHHPVHESTHDEAGAGLFAKDMPPHMPEKIMEWKKKGAPEDKIRHALLKKYSKEDVDEAMRQAGQQ